MAKYLRKFETTASYDAAKDGLVKPNVSYIVEGNGVEYNPFVKRNDIITYSASAKLDETTSSKNGGLHTNAFNTTIKSHTFENGVGTIEFNDDVTSIGNYGFLGCSGMTAIEIPDSVTSIGSSAFDNCSGLTSITIPSGVTSIGNSAFRFCKGLTSIVIPNSVTSIGSSAFDNCSGLTSITIPSGVTSIGVYTFEDCSSLTSIDIPDSVTSIGDYAFQSCSGMTSCTIGSGVTSIGGGAFNHCSSLSSVTLNSNTIVSKNYSTSSSISNIFGGQVTEYIIGDSVTSIGNYAFYLDYSLTSCTIGSGVTSIGYNAFYYCSGLTSITSLASTAPTIDSNTFRDVKTGGTLTVPSGSSGYNVWMDTSDYYLGKYNWTKVEQ